MITEMVGQDANTKGVVFDIQRFSLHDGPGIRTIVFLKGCPLHCQWCANPESISPRQELGFMRARCDKCQKCLPACPERAITMDDQGFPRIERQRCTVCGDCARVCSPGALIMYGREMTDAEAFDEVRRDQIFYEGSDGGVTVSGGEPLHQASFVKALFRLCREAQIHTAIETTGFAARAVLAEVLSLTDYVLFDLKHLDSDIHQKFTGRPNTLILENARLVVASGTPMLFRCPLVPGVNDTPESIALTTRFLKAIQGENAAIELLPYHRLGLVKYQSLDMSCELGGLPPPEPGHVESVRRSYEEQGVHCTISR